MLLRIEIFTMQSHSVLLAFLLASIVLSLVFAEEDTCLFNNQIFRRGESYGDTFVTRCGSAADFPCYCNPDLDPPIECNYCSFAVGGGGLLCARHDEVVSFTDIRGDDKTCSCEASLGSVPSANCNIDISDSSCTVDLPDGTKQIFNDGDVINHYALPNSCGEDYLCFCDGGKVECPYCSFNVKGDDKLCAIDGETVTFEGKDSIYRTCACKITVDGVSSSDCVETSGPPSEAPTVAPTRQSNVGCSTIDREGNIIFIKDGGTFGSSIEGKCGSFEDWPSFCDVGSDGSVIISRTSLNAIDYPYCIFENTLSGETICAKNNEDVNFLDDTGFQMTCSCTVSQADGATSDCRKAERSESPTPTVLASPRSSASVYSTGFVLAVAIIAACTGL